ncbi:MAG: hypothetical protein RBS01_03420, partial [Candidatus Dojkabacteria bacterium]|nr:hypothetical protein [Candidatus Dojkabacteria bacterium]
MFFINKYKEIFIKKVLYIPISLFILLLFCNNVLANTFVVDSTGDQSDVLQGDGICLTSLNTCTLRGAIEEANAYEGYDVINFNIPESDSGYINPDGSRDSTSELAGTYTVTDSGYFQIVANSPLTLSDDSGAFLNGYSQSGASRNTAAFGETINTVLMIELYFYDPTYNNINLLTGDNNHIAGLNIHRDKNTAFSSIVSIDSADNNWIEGNFIGTNINGTASKKGLTFWLSNSSNNNIFGTNGDGIGDKGERNLFGGNTLYYGYITITIVGGPSTGNRVSGNYFGTLKSGRTCIEGDFYRHAIQVEGGSGNIIGTNYDGIADKEESNIAGCITSQFRGIIRMLDTNDNYIQGNYLGISPKGDNLGGNLVVSGRGGVDFDGLLTSTGNIVKGNVIANGDYGVRMHYLGSQFNTITQNSIFNNNADISFILGSKSVNDPGDVDTGPNDLMNHPVIKNVKLGTKNRMFVTLDLDFNLLESPYTLEFFDNDQLSPMGYAQGKYYIGSVTTSQVGNDITLVVPITGRVPTSASLITSTATNGNGSTSEFSPTPTDPVLVIDTVASKPVIQSIGLVNNILDRDTLYVYFTSQRPLIKGSTEANSTVIFKKGSNTYTTTSDTQGKFSIQLNLDRGENILEYYTVDSLENESIHRTLTLMIGTEYFPDTLLVRLGLLTPEVEEEEPEEEQPPVEEEDIPIKQPEEEKEEISVRITLQFLDSEGNPLQSATVVIDGEEYVTNSEGEIQVNNLDVSKKYKAKVSHNGVEYETEVLG